MLKVYEWKRLLSYGRVALGSTFLGPSSSPDPMLFPPSPRPASAPRIFLIFPFPFAQNKPL